VETARLRRGELRRDDADLVLATAHGTKGLEFDHVAVVGMERGRFPNERSVADALEPARALEEERRLAYVGMTRAMRRLFLSHAWRRATWGMGQPSLPSRFLLEIPSELMIGPDLSTGAAALDVDLDLAFGPRGTTRFGRPLGGSGRPASQPAYRQGSGIPGAPPPGETFRPTRDLTAKRDAYAEGAPSGSLGRLGPAPAPGTSVKPPRPVIPGERQFRDGDRVRHGRWGDGIVVTSKLTRSDEEITVAFKDPAVGRKTMLASLANLDLVG
jgi:DNA helicase-2/ATP-dependent DNA helicase PcrA